MIEERYRIAAGGQLVSPEGFGPTYSRAQAVDLCAHLNRQHPRADYRPIRVKPKGSRP